MSHASTRAWLVSEHSSGNSGDILSHGQPSILFRPLLCANIKR
jgi:hypothetical protein